MADLNKEVTELINRIEKLETQVTFLMRREGLDVSEPPGYQLSSAASALLKHGKEKDAIRLIMNETGASLKDVKRIIDKYKL